MGDVRGYEGYVELMCKIAESRAERYVSAYRMYLEASCKKDSEVNLEICERKLRGPITGADDDMIKSLQLRAKKEFYIERYKDAYKWYFQFSAINLAEAEEIKRIGNRMQELGMSESEIAELRLQSKQELCSDKYKKAYSDYLRDSSAENLAKVRCCKKQFKALGMSSDSIRNLQIQLYAEKYRRFKKNPSEENRAIVVRCQKEIELMNIKGGAKIKLNGVQ